jgi:hypothetical protein
MLLPSRTLWTTDITLTCNHIVHCCAAPLCVNGLKLVVYFDWGNVLPDWRGQLVNTYWPRCQLMRTMNVYAERITDFLSDSDNSGNSALAVQNFLAVLLNHVTKRPKGVMVCRTESPASCNQQCIAERWIPTSFFLQVLRKDVAPSA